MSTIPGASPLPSTMFMRDTLLAVLGRDVSLTPSEPWTPTLREPGAVAVYVDDSWQPRALIACNLALSVALGASIALIPARMAAICVEEGRLTDYMAENLHEVLNILAALFNPPGAPHVRLDTVHVPGTLPPAGVSAQLSAFGYREDLKVDVAGYGGGQLSLVLV